MRAPSTLTLLAAAAVTAAVVEAQQGPYSQCGGTAWLGPTTCVSGLKCVVLNQWFYQCLPDSFPGPTPTPSGDSPAATTATPPPAATLGPNLLWIRAVEEPNFHKYLQSSSTGAAILGPASSADQFDFTYGRLRLLTVSPILLAIVHPTVIGPGAGRLAITFETEGDDYGGFKYTGDTLQWKRGGIERPDEGACLVCGGGELFVNLGKVGEAPEGCVDQTIHFYFGETADV